MSLSRLMKTRLIAGPFLIKLSFAVANSNSGLCQPLVSNFIVWGRKLAINSAVVQMSWINMFSKSHSIDLKICFYGRYLLVKSESLLVSLI